MAYLSSLGLENFRTFRERANFDFAPLTILTGPNSSGKSSIFKALLLLQENVRRGGLGALDFAGGLHRLGSFEAALNNRAESAAITFEISLRLSEEDVFRYETFDGTSHTAKTGFEYLHGKFTYEEKGHGTILLSRLEISLGEDPQPLLTAEAEIDAPRPHPPTDTISPAWYRCETTVHGARFFGGSKERADRLLNVSRRVADADKALDAIVGPLKRKFSRRTRHSLPDIDTIVERSCRPIAYPEERRDIYLRENYPDEYEARKEEGLQERRQPGSLSAKEAKRRVLVDSYLPYLREKWNTLERALSPSRLSHTSAVRVEQRKRKSGRKQVRPQPRK